jgi:hypothetical protein
VFSMSETRRFARRAVVVIPILASLAIAGPVAAGQPAIQLLNPPPPDSYVCKPVGGGTICRSSTVEPFALEPTGIFCGAGGNAFEVLDSATRLVQATRYYDGNGNLTRRQRIFDFDGAHFTNPLTGATIGYQQHNTDWDVLAIPGDFGSDTWHGHGVLSVTVPGFGNVLHSAGVQVVGANGDLLHEGGRDELGAYYAGDASVVADLCSALAG